MNNLTTIAVALLDGIVSTINVLAWLSALATVLCGIAAFLYSDDRDKERTAQALALAKRSLKVFLVLAALSCIPGSDQLWKARVNLIKLELSSDENVKAGAAAVTRIAAELECKYLNNCPQEGGK